MMSRSSRNQIRVAGSLLGALLVTVPALAPPHGPEAKALTARLDPRPAAAAGV